MAFFGIGKDKEKTIDLTQNVEQKDSDAPVSVPKNNSDDYIDIKTADERKKKLAQRLVNMNEKIEEISHQIYTLKQRVEVLEKKSGIN